MINKKNYFFSGWIGNLGVVPLVRFLAFLSEPCFLFLFFLLISVTRVLETTRSYLRSMSIYLRFPCLSLVTVLVKAILLLPLPFYADSHAATATSAEQESFILSIGEQIELDLPLLKKYSFGGHEIISHRYFPKERRILIKGKKIGYTNLVTWTTRKKKKTFHFYVLSKRTHLKMARLSETLKQIGLQASFNGPYIKAQGVISTEENYELLQKISKSYKKDLILHVDMSTKLRNQIVAKIYEVLYKNNFRSLSCESQFLKLFCQYKDFPEARNSQALKDLKAQYDITFTALQSPYKNRNFLLRMKILQIEDVEGQEFSFGLQEISTSWNSLFEHGLKSLIGQNKVLFRQKNLNLSLLGEPEMLLTLGKEVQIEVGSEFSYPAYHEASTSVTSYKWKFTGLKVHLTLNEVGNGLMIKYKTQFSRPQNSSISGNKEESYVRIKLNSPLQLFQIGLKTKGHDRTQIPFWGKIPLVGGLFRSQSSQVTYKKITGIIKIERSD